MTLFNLCGQLEKELLFCGGGKLRNYVFKLKETVDLDQILTEVGL
jgi:hypothetical protein